MLMASEQRKKKLLLSMARVFTYIYNKNQPNLGK